MNSEVEGIEHDKSDMLGKLGKFPEQVEESISSVSKLDLTPFAEFRPNNIIVLGMGGSAIGGDILSELLSHDTNKPISTVRNYKLPITADGSTLVFACSYSGNTEETLSAVNEAFARRCKIIGITSGGKLEKFCIENELLLIDIPTGLPPRAAFAYLFFPMLIVLDRLNIILKPEIFPKLIDELKELRDTLVPQAPIKQNLGKAIAAELSKGIPYIYGHTYLNVIAKRWQAQLNENAEVLAMSGGFPEMNHNEIVGWVGDKPEICKKFVAIFFRSADEHPRINKRIELTKEVVSKKAQNVLDVQAVGDTRLTRMISTLYIGDYASVYLALLRGVDPTPVVAIERLKEKMKE